MKRCLVCGFDNKDEANFCVKCGKNLIQQKSALYKKTVFKRWWIWPAVLIIVLLIVLQRLGYIGEDKTTYLVVSEKQITFLKLGGMAGVSIDTDGRRWKVMHCPDWCDIDTEAMHLNIACDKNLSSKDRTDWITIVSGKCNVRVEVEQYGHATYLKLSNTVLSARHDGAKFTINVDTDGEDLNVQYPDYCNVSTYEGCLSVSFDSNPDFSRSGYITVSVDQQKQLVFFEQEGKCRQCNGTGEISCTACFGQGSTLIGIDFYGNPQRLNCIFCNGQGRIECSACSGTGLK
jgi:hypothetical protein